MIRDYFDSFDKVFFDELIMFVSNIYI